jgi:hypothetical protein
LIALPSLPSLSRILWRRRAARLERWTPPPPPRPLLQRARTPSLARKTRILVGPTPSTPVRIAGRPSSSSARSSPCSHEASRCAFLPHRIC